MKPETSTDFLNAWQRMLVPHSLASETLRANTSSFWESQDKLLQEMEDFANGWFERRHQGTRAALEASERMSRAANPGDMFQEYQNWAKGALERVMADGQACQNVLAVIGTFAQPPAMPGGEKDVEHAQSRTHGRPKAA
jgi:hypothetical protein